MCLSTDPNTNKNDIVVQDQILEYSSTEMYLGRHITDDNLISSSVEMDMKKRAENVIIKLRNFVNNNKNVSLAIKLRVFQSCFCSCVLSNCEVWGYYFPKSLKSLFNKGLKIIILKVKQSSPTAIIYLETRQPTVEAIVKNVN